MNLFLTNLFDPAAGSSIWTLRSGEDLLWVVILFLIAAGVGLMLVATLYLAYILRQALGPQEVARPVDTRSSWQRWAGLHTLSSESDLVMEHAYDGIAELDNPTPPWFMGLFYGTIGFGVVYLLVFHVIGSGNIMEQEYTQEVAVADKQREAYLKLVAGKVNENNVTRLTNAKDIDGGKALFVQYCTACHGQNAEGKVGPNLTDEYWLHGGSVKAVYHTINEGVPEKGMISWKKQLNPLQIQQVASYVLSLQGSKPAGAKEPQGDKVTPESPSVAAR
ncbi:cbb3-type cytochrome c oxidase N-terminal domain-containing protein [Spirosoma radiotolerans]|uniref:Cytochrome C n=1 Tax=Spirosoma radiotolerans TaxID=1379870 RepID=A0A0E3V9T5_9BACT|nr:cbb3-type cytochrome c oxidase N-terminal domain-containing protein [Spirosoma radiotolerans]AKD57446.1 cytochrome C [Spirosoma radiotolerans]